MTNDLMDEPLYDDMKYSLKDHAINLVYFLENISECKYHINNCIKDILIFSIQPFIDIKNRSIIKDTHCNICRSFHIENNKEDYFCPCNQFRKKLPCFNCRCFDNCKNENFKYCFLDIDIKELTKKIEIEWKIELIKKSWIKIEKILGDELYELPSIKNNRENK